jgi:hypothetical protein
MRKRKRSARRKRQGSKRKMSKVTTRKSLQQHRNGTLHKIPTQKEQRVKTHVLYIFTLSMQLTLPFQGGPVEHVA